MAAIYSIFTQSERRGEENPLCCGGPEECCWLLCGLNWEKVWCVYFPSLCMCMFKEENLIVLDLCMGES